MTRKNTSRRRRSFTLMEVLLVLVILVILGSMVGVFLSGARKRAFVDAAKTQMAMIGDAVQAYSTDLGTFPNSQQGLAALVQAPADLKNPAKWRGPYLSGQKLPDDPWDNPYGYSSDGESFRIWTVGANGQDEGGSGGDDLAFTGQ